MDIRAGSCQVCSACCLYAIADPRVVVVAEADWVVIRHCRVCGAYWDMQPASYPVVMTYEEALKRVPDLQGWAER
ncbi:MAG: hypothetical protein QM597_05865 [Aeromicrobium sp.]|uniref:hypothetical protein n=1 Tax=Aeromicrobium sp. TaxID=1871063 RepID=UPI0039E5927F